MKYSWATTTNYSTRRKTTPQSRKTMCSGWRKNISEQTTAQSRRCCLKKKRRQANEADKKSFVPSLSARILGNDLPDGSGTVNPSASTRKIRDQERLDGAADGEARSAVDQSVCYRENGNGG